jgi:hypothetical protein
MRLCIRLVVLTALLVALAIGLIALRTDTHQAGNRLHLLFRDKRRLEGDCCRLELAIARLKGQERLHEHVAGLEDEPTDGLNDRGPAAPPGSAGRRTRLTSDNLPGPP